MNTAQEITWYIIIALAIWVFTEGTINLINNLKTTPKAERKHK